MTEHSDLAALALARRLAQQPDEVRQAELDRMRRDRPAMAAAVEALLADDPDADWWFDDLGARLDRVRMAEIDAAWGPGQRVGPFVLERLLGTGGMGAVFLARKADGELKRPLALKLISPGTLPDTVVSLWRRERDALAALSHPNIAQLFDAGRSDDGQPWIAMEFVRGRDFVDWCRVERPSLQRLLSAFDALCDAVRFAHRHLVVHGDLKPTNVLVDEDDRVRLLDFGIAHLIDAGAAEGGAERYLSPAWAAPEIAAGARASVASDVYSLGLMLAALLAELPERTPPELKAVVARACAAEPPDRYESAGQLAAELRAFCDRRPVESYSTALPYVAGKWVRRHAVQTGLMVALAATLVGTAVWSGHQANRFEYERDKARELVGFLQDVFASADPEVAQGRELSARELLDRGVARFERSPTDPALKLEFLMVMARAYQGLALYAPARGLLEESLELMAARNHDPVEVGEVWLQLGINEHLDGRLEAAGTALTEALDLLTGVSSDRGRLLYAEALAYHGRLLSEMNQTDEGRQRLERALAITRDVESGDRVELAERLNDMASVYFRKGDYDRALPLLEEALEIRRRLDRRNDTDSMVTATLLNNMGLMNYLAGRSEVAEPLFIEALELRREILPPNHPEIAQTLTNLGLMLKDYGRPERAVALLEEALEVRRRGLRPDHVRIAKAMHNLAMVYQKTGRRDEATDLFAEAIDAFRKQFGDSHPVVAIAHNDYAALLFEMGQLDQSEQHYRTAQRIRNRLLPPNHPHVAWSLNGLGRVLAARGQYDEARGLFERALAIRRESLPAGDPLLREVEQALAALP